jgi:integrase
MYWDRSVPGFGVRVSGSTNQMSFVAQRDLPEGRTRRVTIAAVGEVTLEQAKAKARDIIHGMRHGIDPKAPRRGGETLRVVAALYLERHDLSEKSRRDYNRVVFTYLADWLDLTLSTVTGTMVEERFHQLARDKGPATANLCMRVFRALFNFMALRNAEAPPNPTRQLRRQWIKVPRRRTLVGAKRLPEFYRAVMALPNPIHRTFVLFVLFTGLRREAAASLCWDQVDFTEGTIRIPMERTKHRRDEFKLPMTTYVRDLLLKSPTPSEDGYVFVANSRRGYLSEPKYPLGIVAEQTGIAVSIHDLRRDYCSCAEHANIGPIALKVLVDHSVGFDVTAGYTVLSAEQLREAAEKVTSLLKRWCRI